MTASRHLIVVVPGVGGSVLRDAEGGDLVWYGGRGALLKSLADPDRLAVGRPLEPVGLIQEFTVIPWLKNIAGYTSLWTKIKQTFPRSHVDNGDPRSPSNRAATIVALPYDFRAGVAAAADRLQAKIHERVRELGDDTKVVVVAHSMGGLVARLWVAEHDTGERCRGIITLGTPHGGAPKALDVLVNGLYWRSKRTQSKSLSSVVQSWRGLHDLVGTNARLIDSRGRRHRPSAVAGLPMAQRINVAAAIHERIAQWWGDPDRRHRPSLIPYAGRGHGTMSHLTWDGTTLRPQSGRLGKEPLGDATVPYWSAIPTELSGDRADVARPTDKRHGDLVDAPGLRSDLLAFNDGPQVPAVRGGGRVGDSLGLDVDDIIGAGERLDGVVLFGGEQIDCAPALTVSVEAVRADGLDRGQQLVVEHGDDGGFSVQLPEGPEGDVEVRAHGYRTDTDQRFEVVERVAVLP